MSLKSVEKLDNELDNESDVVGLDDMLKSYIYICHASKPDQKYKISVDNIITPSEEKTENVKSIYLFNILKSDSTIIDNQDSAIQISIGSYEDFMFIIHYFDFYENILIEYNEPEKPLNPAWSLREICGEEFIIFKELLFPPEPHEKFAVLSRLRKIINIVNYFSMPKLLNKVCALVAFLCKELDVDDIKELKQFMLENQ